MANFVPTRRGEVFKPRIVSSDPSYGRRELAASVLPKNATLAPSAGRREAAGFFGGNMPMGVSPYPSGGGGSAMYHMQRPYMPGVESPDRVQYPKTRQEANRAWRLFHETDPIFGTAVDMYAEMLVSDFDISVGDEKSREIRDTLEYMCQVSHLMDRLRYIIKEYLVMGEAIPHCFFDDSLGIWTYIAMHNPDYIDVVDAPVVNMDPIINFVPDEELRRMLADGSPEAREFRSRLPAEFVSKIMARQKIRLSPLNTTFIARKLHPYQVRGTSLASRMWRIFMVEDAVYNSTIATYRRHAAPVKVLKLGDPATGWIPAPGAESKLLEMLNRAEVDPQCFVPETLVTLGDGSQRPIGDLDIGDELLDKDGAPCSVLALEREGTDQLVEIDVVGSPSIRCTPNHKWPVWGGPRTCSCGCGEVITGGNFSPGHGTHPGGYRYQEMPADAPKKTQTGKVRFLEGFDPYQKLLSTQLRPGDYLMIPRRFEENRPENVTREKARLLGYYVAEGNTVGVYEREDGSVRKGFELSFGADEKDTLVRDACSIVEALCDYRPEVFYGDRSNCQVRARRNASIDLAEWLELHGGSGARTKRLSGEVMSWPLDLKYEFLKGYIGGDGSSIWKKPGSSGRYVEVSSSSRNLINQVKLILAQWGTYGNFSEREQSEETFGPGNAQYRLHVYGQAAADLSRDIWGFELQDVEGRTPRQWWTDNDYLYVKVRGVKVVECEEPQTVVNMTVSGDHSYLTDCIGTRNSWLIYHYGINFEAWGTNDRAVTINKEHDVIEKVKLLALGLSKSFMTGEVTYACSVDGTSVRLSDGSYSEIQDIQRGDVVVDRFGHPRGVTDVLKYPSPDEMVKLTLYGDRELTLTDNHKLPVFTRPHECLCGCGEDLGDAKATSGGRRKWRSFSPQHHKLSMRGGRDREWVDYMHGDRVIASFPAEHEPFQRLRADEVRVGDWLMIPRGFEECGVEATPGNLARARLLGYYTAEGSTDFTASDSGNKVTRFSFGRVDCAKESFYVADVAEILESLGHLCTIQRNLKHPESEAPSYTVYVPTAATGMSNYLESRAGKGSDSKNFSSEVMGWGLELKRELLKGMYRGDGYLFKQGNRLDVVYTTTSTQLMRQLEVILTQLGYSCYVHTSPEREDEKGYVHKECHYITCAGKQARSLAELIWSDVPDVWAGIDREGFDRDDCQGERHEVFVDDEFVYLPVKSVEVVRVDQEAHPYVYSLTVEETSSYTLDNIASFNSAKSGLQVFLRRLLSLRQFLENMWLYPKYFRPISEINEWTTSSPSEVNHKYRIKRTAQEIQEQNLVLMPTVKWKNKLDPSVDQDLLNAYKMLEQGFGIKLSKSTVTSAVGVDWQDELDKSLREFKSAEEMKKQTLGKADLQKYEQQGGPQGAQPPGTPGAGAKPPAAAGKPPGGAAPAGGAGGGLLAPGGMNDASQPPGSAEGGGVLQETIESPSGGGLPTGVG